jgi:nucleotide sugar dehydrogenase
MKKKIGVIGLGYVGLPLALLAEEKGFSVTGLDLSKKKLQLLKDKISPIDDKDAKNRLKKSNITFTNDFTNLQNVDIAIVCVPTPVHEDKIPDLSIVKDASIVAAKNLRENSLLIIESTINPGVCDEVIIPAIEKESSHKIGKTLHIAHCPERINPGDPKWHVGNINRVLGANSDEALEIAYSFYSHLIDAEIKKMDNIKEAEACKVVENSFRDINIAFVNELAMSFEKLGINVVNVIDGAATKPFAFMPHYPGIGVGGHCIPVDPYYLIEYARGNGFEHHFLTLARKINENMPIYSVDGIERKLIENGQGNLSDKNVVILGLSYKSNVGDDRESPSTKVIKTLKERGANVDTYDPYFLEKSTAKNLDEALINKDVVILATPHSEFSEIKLSTLKDGSVFFDGRNSFIKKKDEFRKNNIIYMGIGARNEY